MAKTTKNDSDATKENINKGIRNIATRATWMLGVLVLIILGLASFIFKDIDAELQVGSLYWIIWHTAIFTCIIHLALLLFYIRQLIVPNFDDYLNESNAKRLTKLIKTFKSLIILFISSVPAAFVFALLLWVGVALTI